MSSTHASRSSVVLHQRAWQRRSTVFFRYCVLVVVALLILIPFIWVVSLAFSNPAEAFAYPPHLIPQHPTLDNFVGLLTGNMVPVALVNSIIVAGTATLTNIFFATMAGYAFARLQFPGRDSVFFLLIATTMVPTAVTLIPLFLLVKGFPLSGGNDLFGQGGSGLLNTLPGLMIPHIVQALNIFLARQFFMGQPEELAEAARVDGAFRWCLRVSYILPHLSTHLAADDRHDRHYCVHWRMGRFSLAPGHLDLAHQLYHSGCAKLACWHRRRGHGRLGSVNGSHGHSHTAIISSISLLSTLLYRRSHHR
jgi:ABC-type glycerol-3-phosphate transport system permease component